MKGRIFLMPRYHNRELVERFHQMEKGEYVDIDVPHDRPLMTEKERIKKLLSRYVRKERPHVIFTVRIRARRKIRVSCRGRGRGRNDYSEEVPHGKMGG